MRNPQLFSLAVLLGVWLLVFTEAAYKRDYTHHQRNKKPAGGIGRSPRASYPNRQPEIPALYSAPKPQKLQQETDQSANDVEYSEQQSTTTEIPVDEDQLVIDAADDGANLPEHEEDEGTSEDYQLQGAGTERPAAAALQEDPSLNEFPTSASLLDDSSSYFRRKPVQNSYERGHNNRNSFRQEDRQPENQNAREETLSQYLPPVIISAAAPQKLQQPLPQRSPLTQNQFNPQSPGSGYASQPTQPQNNHNQQRRLPDQQQIETKPFQNHIQVQVISPNANREQNGIVNSVGQNIPARQYLPQYQQEPQGGNSGYSNYGPPPPPQQQQTESSSPVRFPTSSSQNEIPNYSSSKKDESEPMQLEGLSESIVDAELLQRVQQIIEEHEKQQKEYLEKQFRENDNAFSQTNRQSTTGGYSNDNNGRVPLQQQVHNQAEPSPSSYFPSSAHSPTSSLPSNNAPQQPQQQNFEPRPGNTNGNQNQGSFDQQLGYFHPQTQNNYPAEPQQQYSNVNANVNGNTFGDFRSQNQNQNQPQQQQRQIEPIAPTSRQFDFGGSGGYADSGEPQGRGFGPEEQRRHYSPAPAFRDVGNSIFSQDEPESRGNNNIYEQNEGDRTSKLNNYGIGSERPEGKSYPLKTEPEIEYQKAVLSTHFTETQPDPEFQAQQQRRGEYLPPTGTQPPARIHPNSQFSTAPQLNTPNAESRSPALNSDLQQQNQVQHVNNEPFQFYQTERIPFQQPQQQQQQPQPSFPTQTQAPFKNNNQPEFTSVNVNAGLIVSGRGQEIQSPADSDVVYGVPASNLPSRRPENTQYPSNSQDNFFSSQQQQQQPTGNGEAQAPQYLPPFQQPQFGNQVEQQINSNPFTASHGSSNNNNNNNQVIIAKSEDFIPQNNPNQNGDNFNQNPEPSYGIVNSQQQQQQQHQQPQPSFFQQPEPQPFFSPGASFFNNNDNSAQLISNDNDQEQNQDQQPQQQQQSEPDTVPRPVYGVPLAPVISLDSGEGGLEEQGFSPLDPFYGGGDSAQGLFPSFATTHSINNNYLTPQALAETPFNPFPQPQPQQQQQLFPQQQNSVYGIPATQEQLSSPDSSSTNSNTNNNRNDEQNGYGNIRNDNSAHLDQIPLLSNTVSIPTRDYSPPTSYSYSSSSRQVHPQATSPSTNSYGRIRRRLSSLSSSSSH